MTFRQPVSSTCRGQASAASSQEQRRDLSQPIDLCWSFLLHCQTSQSALADVGCGFEDILVGEIISFTVVGRKLPFSLLGLPSTSVRDREAIQFMRGIMDECTHLKNFSTPVDTSLIIAICATDDGYVPREGVTHLADVWPGAEVRYINTGHVGAYLMHQTAFR